MYILLCRKTFYNALEGMTSKTALGRKPSDLQFPLIPNTCFISYSLTTTFSYQGCPVRVLLHDMAFAPSANNRKCLPLL